MAYLRENFSHPYPLTVRFGMKEHKKIFIPCQGIYLFINISTPRSQIKRGIVYILISHNFGDPPLLIFITLIIFRTSFQPFSKCIIKIKKRGIRSLFTYFAFQFTSRLNLCYNQFPKILVFLHLKISLNLTS